ncbi:MAG: hypothetical protein AAGA48_06380 [Myxococcota bacterium]
MSDEQAIRAVVEAAGDEVLALLRTAGEHAFVADDDTVTKAPRYVVASQRRCWIVAATEDGRTWAWATGEVDTVRLETGWTRDRLHVGPWWLPLRTRTRTEGQALVAQFARGGGGEAIRPKPGRTFPLIASAKGAIGVTDELRAPNEASTERWLVGLTTATTRPFNHHHGTLHESPWVLLVSTHRTLMVARAPWGEMQFRRVDRLEVVMPSAGRPTLTADGHPLLAPTGARASVPVLHDLHEATTPGERWRIAAASALEEPDPARAVSLWTEARALGAEGPGPSQSLPELAAVAWAFDQGVVTVRSWSATSFLPDDPVGFAKGVEDRDRALRRALGRQNVRWSTLGAGLALDALPAQARVEGLPWPCERYAEAMATGLALRGTPTAVAAAAALWGLVSPDARRYAGLAVLRERVDTATGRATWRQAAEAFAKEEAWEAAMDAWARAMGEAGTASDHAQLARYARSAHADPAPHWRAALAQDPQADFLPVDTPPDEWASLLDAAPDHAPAAQARALEALIADGPTVVRYEALATLYEDRLGRPHDAATTLTKAAELVDARAAVEAPVESDDPMSTDPRYARWIRIARLYAVDGETEAAVGALVEALTGDFLQPEAYHHALHTGVVIEPTLRTWWTHLHDVLGTTPPEPHRRWIEGFDDTTLDTLHPGGIGWLGRLRQTIDPSETPDRTVLTRGLERLTEEAWPREHRAIREVSKVLGLSAPETFLYRGEGAWGISAWPTDPPVVLMGITHLEPGERALDDAALTFALAVELSHLRCGHPLLALDQSLVGTSRSMYSAFGRYATTAENVFDLITLVPGIDQIAKLQSLFRLGRRMFAARTALDKATSLATPLWERLTGRSSPEPSGIGRENLQGAGLQVRMHADRIALLVTGDLHAAIRAILTASTKSAELLQPIAKDGLLSVLTTDRMPVDEALRITALIAFAARQRPDQKGATP